MTPYDLVRYVIQLFGRQAPLLIVAALAVYAYRELGAAKHEQANQVQADFDTAYERLKATYESLTSLSDWQAKSIDRWIAKQDELTAIQDRAVLENSKEPLRIAVLLQFDRLRKERTAYVDEEWMPAFLENWVDFGRLVEVAKGEIYWSDEIDDFVPAGKEGLSPKQLIDTVNEWTLAAFRQIRAKERELLDPLEEDQRRILDAIQNAEDLEDNRELIGMQQEAELKAAKILHSLRRADAIGREDRITLDDF